ncbi:MAG: hypothetical protein ACFCVD_24970 [Nodosilinea sp.]
MNQNSHPELDGQDPQSLYVVHLKRPGQTLRERLSWSLIGLSVGLSIATGFFLVSPAERSWPWQVTSPAAAQEDPFRQGVNQAMGAAELTQTAEFKEQWVEVVMLWQQAIDRMKSVTKANPNYELAQQKVAEYARNLQYAQSNVNTRRGSTPSSQNYWTVGSDQDWVMAIQGTPDQVLGYDSSCQQVLRYGQSMVELRNGYVKQYDNIDGNLKVLANAPVALSTQASPSSWTLGTPQEEVLRIQGTPTRTDKYSSEKLVTIYYGNSSILLDSGQVVSYVNTDGNLKVSMAVANFPTYQPAPSAWQVGSSRAEVLRVQQETPVAISRNDINCEEVLYFDASEVSLKQGLVTGYKNESQNLRIR